MKVDDFFRRIPNGSDLKVSFDLLYLPSDAPFNSLDAPIGSWEGHEHWKRAYRLARLKWVMWRSAAWPNLPPKHLWEMTDTHLLNAEKWLGGRGARPCNLPPVKAAEFKEYMRLEIERRKILHADTKGIELKELSDGKLIEDTKVLQSKFGGWVVDKIVHVVESDLTDTNLHERVMSVRTDIVLHEPGINYAPQDQWLIQESWNDATQSPRWTLMPLGIKVKEKRLADMEAIVEEHNKSLANKPKSGWTDLLKGIR